MDILREAIGQASEAREIGAATLNKLEAQSEQLRRIDGDLNDINQSLAKSERRIANMMSIRTAIVNTWRKPVQEASTMYVPKKKSSNQTKQETKQETEIRSNLLDIPKNVNHGSKLSEHKVKTKLKAKGIEFGKTEDIMYHYSNTKKASMFVSDATSDCIVMTTGRIIKLISSKLDTEILFQDVISVKHIKNGAFKNDKIEYTLADGRKDTMAIVNRSVVDFFLDTLNVIIDQIQMDSIGKNSPYAEEDALLDDLGNVLDDLNIMGKQMGTELKAQNDHLNHLDGTMDSTINRVDKNNRNLNKLLGKK